MGYAPVFVPFNQGSDYLHQRGERMRFVFADFVDQGFELGDESSIFLFGVACLKVVVDRSVRRVASI